MLDLLLDGVRQGQARLGRLMWPVTRRLMVAGMNARPALIPELEQRLKAELDWFEDELVGRRHLVGDQLGASRPHCCQPTRSSRKTPGVSTLPEDKVAGELGGNPYSVELSGKSAVGRTHLRRPPPWKLADGPHLTRELLLGGSN